jgi:peroxiredoxin Q/BCP
MASVDTLEDNTGFAKKESADFPILSDPTKATAQKYGVLSERGFANRWTFYIGKDGRILAIDKSVKAASAGPDVAAKLAELGIARTR